MIKLAAVPMDTVENLRDAVQKAVELEFATLPPYLYAKFSIPPGKNMQAAQLIDSVVGEEMIHMCLACNILNAIGGTPNITAPRYPGHLPGDVARDTEIHLYPFSQQAMQQAMTIEEPTQAIDPPILESAIEEAPSLTIGEYYEALDKNLGLLPADAWHQNRNQIGDEQYFAGQLFPINSYADASQAIHNIVSEGEGTPVSPGVTGDPLDFQNDLAHYYRFWEVAENKVLTVADNAVGYGWAGTLGVDWAAVYPAISDPATHDFSADPQAARDAQAACNAAFTSMVNELNAAFSGNPGQLGVAVRSMFNLRQAAMQAFTTPLADGHSVAGPAFVYQAAD